MGGILKTIWGFASPFLPQALLGLAVIGLAGFVYFQIQDKGRLEAELKLAEKVQVQLTEQLEEQKRLVTKRDIVIERDVARAQEDQAALNALKARNEATEKYFASATTKDNICFTEEDALQLQNLWN